MDGLLIMTRAMHRSCLCPCEKSSPFSETTVSYPFGSLRIKESMWQVFAIRIISSSVISGFPIVIFSRMVPDFSQVS